MHHSKRTDSFCFEDEHFFASYQAEPASDDHPLAVEFDVSERPSAEQLAHFTRFRRPVAWVMAAMSSLSLLALGQHGLRQHARHDRVAHVDSVKGLPTSVAANHLAAASVMRSQSVSATGVAEAPWSWSELAESTLAYFVDPTPASASARKPPAFAESSARAHLVTDFTSALLSMCRNVPA